MRKYSCVGIYRGNGVVDIIPNDQGNRITPSYVAFQGVGPPDTAVPIQRLVGDAAKNQASSNPRNTIFDVKRFIGRKFSDFTVQQDKPLVPYELVSDPGKSENNIRVRLSDGTTTYTPEAISAMVLRKLKKTAEEYLGEEVKRAVITVPGT